MFQLASPQTISRWNNSLCLCVFIFQGYSFLISSDYERAEWKEIIKEQQKKCTCPRNVTLKHLFNSNQDILFIFFVFMKKKILGTWYFLLL